MVLGALQHTPQLQTPPYTDGVFTSSVDVHGWATITRKEEERLLFLGNTALVKWQLHFCTTSPVDCLFSTVILTFTVDLQHWWCFNFLILLDVGQRVRKSSTLPVKSFKRNGSTVTRK